MEFIAKPIESIFRRFTDEQILLHGLTLSDLAKEVERTDYQAHMNAIYRINPPPKR
jgi:hypothetical protein